MQLRHMTRFVLVPACIAVLFAPTVAYAQMPGAAGMPGGQPTGMPDARMMSGIPMPMADLPAGTVSVRVVRGEISSMLPNQPVDLIVNGATRTAKTGADGRAQFAGLTAGASAQAVTVVDGERLESQMFPIPAAGGVRLLLAASGTAAAGARPNATPVSGSVTFGGDSRVAIEFDDDTMSVYYLLDIVNNGTAPVNPRTTVSFDLPADAISPTLLEGSSPQAAVKGRRVSVAAPFKPGRTTFQIAYQLPPAGGTRTLTQQFPLAFDSVAVAVQQPGDVQIASPQIRDQRQMPAEGKSYIMASGPALPAGRALTLDMSGLPHHESWPRMLALAVAALVLLVGAWAALGRQTDGSDARRRELEGRREQLFAELLRIEESKRGGVDDGEDRERRSRVMKELESIYGELDTPVPQPAPAGADRGTP